MKRPSGFIALISVLILAAVALLIGSGVLVRALGESDIQESHEQAARAEAAATHCAETALMKLKTDDTYAGNETLTLSSGDTCRILAVGGSGNSDRTVQTTSIVMGTNRSLSISISEIDPDMRISSWQDD